MALPPPPIIATVIANGPNGARASRAGVAAGGDLDALCRLSAPEREWVRHMKRKDRTEVMRRLADDAKRMKLSVAPLRVQVLQSNLSTRMQIFEELRTGGCEKYLQWVRKALQLPLRRRHAPSYLSSPGATAGAIARAREIVDANATGFDLAKLEVLKLVCRAVSGGTDTTEYAIGLEGAPGTGKTHFVRHALAPALDRPMISIQLGGATDVSYLLGNVYTYEGSREGRLAAALIEAGCCNPIIYFDEVDKVSDTDRGREIIAVLIHLIDPTANAHMRDRYFHGIDLDFSQCTFVFSYNDATHISHILLDRIRRVHIPTPTLAARERIVYDHIIPRARARVNADFCFERDAVRFLVERSASASGGMRSAEREIDHVMSAAQLRSMCADATVCGVDEDAGRCITRAFARECLELQDRAEDRCASRVPPPMMYS